ncbi:hypothetical protein [Pseudonocardia sp. HH130629-09]|uniref:hypothetical protein n=1 Tax=Pseudonocardia sp. HH130629-09 TaxID=1641402 RepID=UPI000AB160DA|nr:hypothetical protein [Pseudonocardia sp. HH130629-09]
MDPALVWIIVCGAAALFALVAAVARIPALAGLFVVAVVAAALVSTFVAVGTAVLS